MVYSWESRYSKKRKRNRLILVISAIVLVTVPLFVGSAGLLKLMRLKREQRLLKQQILILKAENEVLAHRVELYQRSNELVERKARDELGMIRDGEKVYQIQPAQKP